MCTDAVPRSMRLDTLPLEGPSVYVCVCVIKPCRGTRTRVYISTTGINDRLLELRRVIDEPSCTFIVATSYS